MPSWTLPAAAVVALAPGLAAIALGAPWQAVVWWFALALPATMVLVVVPGSVAMIAAQRRTLRRAVQPHERTKLLVTTACLVAAVLAIPATAVALAALGVGIPTAVVASLIAGYAIWHAAYAVLGHPGTNQAVVAPSVDDGQPR
jgi:hypothetical protein